MGHVGGRECGLRQNAGFFAAWDRAASPWLLQPAGVMVATAAKNREPGAEAI
jgi:hypothetical protein